MGAVVVHYGPLIVDWASGENALRLSVDGYEFPGMTGSFDGEWLTIRGEVSCSRGSWQFVDPCLLSGELLSLARFLEAPSPDGKACTFTEPCLWFARTSPDGVEAGFEADAAPPWDARREVTDMPQFRLSFELTAAQRATTAASLRAAAAAFPPQRA